MKQLEIYLNNGLMYVTFAGKTTKEEIMASEELQGFFILRARRHLKTKTKNLKVSDVKDFIPK